ncbi:MAG TPA: peptidase MA family metallohydrolase [Terriglobales bacterium]|nr:peptidase MA family metallohydrolase [Terriglobales bacterium]
MRFRVILFGLLAVAVSAADTIHLKNGRRIVADKVRTSGDHVEYQIGDNTFAIPKSLVDHIDAGGVPGAAPGDALPALVPQTQIKGWEDLRAKLIHDGKVDPAALAALDKAGDPELAAAAYFVAGAFEAGNGRAEPARLDLEQALRYQPNNAIILANYANVLLALRRFAEAVPYAEKAVRLAPDSFDAQAVLGVAYFQSGRTKEAIAAWKRALALQPNATVQGLLDKAEREQAVESNFGEQESSHFILRFEGGQSSPRLRRQILETLEAHYSELVGTLGAEPRDAISVTLYTNQAFFDVTAAPSWTGALNDGKLRIPIEGKEEVDSELSRVLKHELAHSFINQITHGRCPVWLNEGVAMAVEPRSSAGYGRELARVFATQTNIPLNQLEGSFLNFSPQQAAVAYAESLAAVEYIRDTYGMSDVQRILQRIGEGASTESALRATIHDGYAQLQDEIAAYLKRTYGD